MEQKKEILTQQLTSIGYAGERKRTKNWKEECWIHIVLAWEGLNEKNPGFQQHKVCKESQEDRWD